MKIKTAYDKMLAASAARKKQVHAMREAGMRWTQIAKALGITRQRAQQIGSKK
jgi:predicted transcriptional regulator